MPFDDDVVCDRNARCAIPKPSLDINVVPRVTAKIVMVDPDVRNCAKNILKEDVRGSIASEDDCVALDEDIVLSAFKRDAADVGIGFIASVVVEVIILHHGCAGTQCDAVFAARNVISLEREATDIRIDDRVAIAIVAGADDVAVLDRAIDAGDIDNKVGVSGNLAVSNRHIGPGDGQRSVDDLVLDHRPVGLDRHRTGIGSQSGPCGNSGRRCVGKTCGDCHTEPPSMLKPPSCRGSV